MAAAAGGAAQVRRSGISWRVRGLVMAQCYLRGIDRFLCNWCCERLTADQVVIDHWMPVALGGSNHPDNLTVACARCNAMKAASHPVLAEERINAFLEAESL